MPAREAAAAPMARMLCRRRGARLDAAALAVKLADEHRGGHRALRRRHAQRGRPGRVGGGRGDDGAVGAEEGHAGRCRARAHCRRQPQRVQRAGRLRARAQVGRRGPREQVAANIAPRPPHCAIDSGNPVAPAGQLPRGKKGGAPLRRAGTHTRLCARRPAGCARPPAGAPLQCAPRPTRQSDPSCCGASQPAPPTPAAPAEPGAQASAGAMWGGLGTWGCPPCWRPCPGSGALPSRCSAGEAPPHCPAAGVAVWV